MRSMRDNLPASTLIMGSVKADGYGHGSVPVAKTIEPYVFGYAVATIDEGIILRRHGINKTILILGVTHESQYEELLRYDIRTAMFQYEKAKKLYEECEKRSISIRSYGDELENVVRITVGSKEENNEVIDVIKEVF